ncbi:globin domain-containing protein [Spirosoma areae]
MTPEQFALVKQTWRLLRDIDPSVLGSVFYGQLFMQFPTLQSMFKTSMESQYQKFMDMLSLIVSRIDRAGVTEELVQLAQRHTAYGVKPAHYKAVGQALLWTLEQGLGKDWNAEVHRAWEACYDDLTRIMLKEV